MIFQVCYESLEIMCYFNYFKQNKAWPFSGLGIKFIIKKHYGYNIAIYLNHLLIVNRDVVMTKRLMVLFPACLSDICSTTSLRRHITSHGK